MGGRSEGAFQYDEYRTALCLVRIAPVAPSQRIPALATACSKRERVGSGQRWCAVEVKASIRLPGDTYHTVTPAITAPCSLFSSFFSAFFFVAWIYFPFHPFSRKTPLYCVCGIAGRCTHWHVVRPWPSETKRSRSTRRHCRPGEVYAPNEKKNGSVGEYDVSENTICSFCLKRFCYWPLALWFGSVDGSFPPGTI